MSIINLSVQTDDITCSLMKVGFTLVFWGQSAKHYSSEKT